MSWLLVPIVTSDFAATFLGTAAAFSSFSSLTSAISSPASCVSWVTVASVEELAGELFGDDVAMWCPPLSSPSGPHSLLPGHLLGTALDRDLLLLGGFGQEEILHEPLQVG